MGNPWEINLKKGDIVVCITDKLKNFTKDELYEVNTVQYDNIGPFRRLTKISLVGFKGLMSVYNFKEVDIKEVRAEKLKALEGIKTRKLTKDIPSDRKIDRNPEEKIFNLINLLLGRYVTDRKKLEYSESWKKYYNYYSDLDGYIKKIVETDKVFGVEIEDFGELKDMKLFEALELFIKNKTK